MVLTTRSPHFALCIVLVGVVLSGWSYSLIYQETQKLLSGPRIETKPSKFSFLQGEVCVGTAESEYKLTDEGSALYVRGLLHGISESPINGELSFNQLGQLVGAIFEVALPGGSFRFGTAGVDPIVAKVRGSILGKEIDLAFPIPGPLELMNDGDGFRLIDTRGRISGLAPAADLGEWAIRIVLDTNSSQCVHRGRAQIPPSIQSYLLSWGTKL